MTYVRHMYCVNDGQRLITILRCFARGLHIGTAPLPEMEYLYEPNASIMKSRLFLTCWEERYGDRSDRIVTCLWPLSP